METTSKPSRAFTEAHHSALIKGAKRRSDEQLVGNWIRVTNPALYARLLLEATAPPKSTILSDPTAVERDEPQVTRQPPPRLDIR